MADDPRKLRKLLEILNENGVTSYKDASGIEILIQRDAPVQELKPPVRESIYSLDEFGEPEHGKPQELPSYSDDEMLLWSADGGVV